MPLRAILLLDIADGCLPDLEEIKVKLEENVVYMPLGIIATFRTYYLQESFKEIVSVLDTKCNMTIKDCRQSFNIFKAIDVTWKKKKNSI